MRSVRPGVVLLGTDSPISLGIIRELGARGVAVHGIGSTDSIGKSSRYVESFEPRSSGRQELIAQIKRVGVERKAAFVMTVSEADIELLNDSLDELAPLRPLIPGPETFALAVSKEKTLAAAGAVGLSIPTTIQPWSPTLSENANASKLSYPVVLKWSNPNVVQDALHAAGLPMEKAYFCFSEAEVQKYLEQFTDVGLFPLVQEYCPGVGLGHFVFMHEGRALQCFQHLRLREWPPEGGTSTACVGLGADEHPELMRKSIALLRRLGWEGVAMVEYRHDPETGRSVLMEINGRFWGSFPLAVASKAGFAWLQYSVLGLREIPEIERPIAGKTCVFVLPELRRLFRLLFQPGKISDPLFEVRPLRELGSFILGLVGFRTCYFVFRWTDPGPFFADMANVFRRVLSERFR